MDTDGENTAKKLWKTALSQGTTTLHYFHHHSIIIIIIIIFCLLIICLKNWNRSYYRCTSTSCNVKKRVERSFNDSSIVVTTYEGQHTHPTPIIHRPTPQSSAFLFTNPTAVPPHIATLSRQLQLNSHVMAVAPVHLNSGFTSSRDIFTGALGKRFSASDDGLLQDIVPSASTVRKEDDILWSSCAS